MRRKCVRMRPRRIADASATQLDIESGVRGSDLRPERTPQQATTVQPLNPLAIARISFLVPPPPAPAPVAVYPPAAPANLALLMWPMSRS